MKKYNLLLILSAFFIITFYQGLQTVTTKNDPQIIILLGAPGSGKGTQASRLSKELSIPHISTGDLFRENISKNTQLGQKAQKYINAGQLVPDGLVIDMIVERMSLDDCKNGFILDGVPRTLAQAQALDSTLPDNSDIMAINIVVNDDDVARRISGRRVCPKCNQVYHIENNLPKVPGKCDVCGTELIQRQDDVLETVKERLRVYHLQTKPLDDLYRQKGILYNVDGSKTPNEVFEEILNVVKTHQTKGAK